MLRKFCSVLFLALALKGCAWLGGRRLLAASLLMPAPAMAETPSGPRVMQSLIKYPEFIRMEGPTGDFSIFIPSNWRVTFDDAPGRLILASENNAGYTAATLQVARLPLSGLLSASGFKAPADSSDWRQVAASEAARRYEVPSKWWPRQPWPKH